MTKIQWTDETWNPVTGCTKVSQGCKNCYAERIFPRPYGKTGRKFTDVATHPERLEQPLRWRKPRRIFVNSMSDLFHEAVPDIFLDRAFAVMAKAEQHEFQILTKRPERMLEYVSKAMGDPDCGYDGWYEALEVLGVKDASPLQNVLLGVSVENQETADQRIPLLLETPSGRGRFVSYEPALGPVNFTHIETGDYRSRLGTWCAPLTGTYTDSPRINWVIVGGETGPGARPFNIAWARDTIRQCREAGVACFVKQLGTFPLILFQEEQMAGSWQQDGMRYRIDRPGAHAGKVLFRDRKGGEMKEWPEDLRIRQFPEVTR